MCNDPEQRQINAVAQELKCLALHAHSEPQKQIWACIMCGNSHEQELEETTADFLLQTAEPGQTLRERHLKVAS